VERALGCSCGDIVVVWVERVDRESRPFLLGNAIEENLTEARILIRRIV
jgi:hypothetical protein